MESNIETLLESDPYTLTKNEKGVIFLNSMKEAVSLHYEKSKEFRKICDNRGFAQTKNFSVEEIPFLPVSLFKKFKLKSVPDSEIFKTVYSSATTSDLPSIIFLDRITSERQTSVLISIMRNFLNEKKDFLVIDQDNSMNTLPDIKSRSSAIRGFFPFMKSVKFGLDDDLKLDEAQFQELNEKSVCVFGFTWLLYKTISENKDNIKIKNIFQKKSPIYRVIKSMIQRNLPQRYFLPGKILDCLRQGSYFVVLIIPLKLHPLLLIVGDEYLSKLMVAYY